MEKFERNRLIGGCIGLVLCVALLIFTSRLAKKQHDYNIVYEFMKNKAFIEAGYVKGQADALKGIIRIHVINDSTYTWTSSPWGTVKPVNDTVTFNIKYK